MCDKIKQILGCLVILFALSGSIYGSFQVFATNARVDFVEQDLKRYKQTQRLNELESRIWKYDDKWGFDCERCPQEVKDNYRRLKQELRDIERKLQEKT